MFRILAIMCLVPSSVAAGDCVTADDLATGIVFEQQQLGEGLVQTVKGNRVRITYASNTAEGGTEEVLLWGVYRESEHVWDTGEGLNTQQDWTDSYRFSGKPPLPEPGLDWSAKMTRKRKGEIEGEKISDRAEVRADYTCEAPRSVTLGGCDYRVMTVTGRFTADGVDYILRYAYFPDLGFGLETRWTDTTLFEAEVTRGILALSPKS